MIEAIIENNNNLEDEKSRYLNERAGKYLKILWKTMKLKYLEGSYKSISTNLGTKGAKSKI
jgi:hypothetical protein